MHLLFLFLPACTRTTPTPIAVDCTAPIGEMRMLEAPRGFHGLAFDRQGGLWGTDGLNLLRANDEDTVQLVAANIGALQQLLFLPDDTLLAAEYEAALLRIEPDGNRERITADVNAYGLALGPHGRIYGANRYRVFRIEAEGGPAETVLDHTQLPFPKVLVFDRSLQWLNIGTSDMDGAIFRAAVAPDGSLGDPELFAHTPGVWHDGLVQDACGRLILSEYETRSLYRVHASGEVELLHDFREADPDAYAHGLTWGSGIGAWSDSTLYFPQPFAGNRVGAIDVGVPSHLSGPKTPGR